FACIFYGLQNLEKKVVKENHFLSIAENNRSFTHLVQSLNANSGATFLFESVPKELPENVVLAIIRIKFHDWNMKASTVEQCNESLWNNMNTEMLCVSYENRTVR